MEQPEYDVVVVGAGNAAMCAALSAQEQGARVLVLERAPVEQSGGNSAYTGGIFRFAYNGLDDIRKIVPDLTEQEIANTDFGAYPVEQYLDDFGRITQYHCDPDLIEVLVRRSTETVRWIAQKVIRFAPLYGVHAYKHEGRFQFSNGIVIGAVGGGRGMIAAQAKLLLKNGGAMHHNARATSLLHGQSGVQGVRATIGGVEQDISARAVVLACGGFEANREWRTRYLGPGWDLAKVRGTRYNTGDGIRMALNMGAQPFGQWSGCHGISWERYAPDFGELDARTSAQRNCYHFGIMVNADGNRFLDEGADFRNLTFGKYGRIVLEQPGGCAWQVFDGQGIPFLRQEYRRPGATKAEANTLEDLANRMEGIDRDQFLKTVREYNASIKREVPYNPNVKDGRCTIGLKMPKSNWANPIEVPPFEAYSVGVAITYTYGGLKIDTAARVLDMADAPLPGLYAAGELVGGIFYFNYPGGSGLMSGGVFGRVAGQHAGAYACGREHPV